jgi:hypothetical protein
MRALLDTDVNLDFILERHPFFAEADEIFFRCSNGDFEAYICDITPINIYYIARKEIGRKKTVQAIADVLKLSKVCGAERRTLQNALDSSINDFEDAVQHQCAVEAGLDAIVTRNTDDYTNSLIQVYSPVEFLEVLQKQPTS